MMSFTIITSTPAVLRDRLIERGIIKEVIDQTDGSTTLVGVREGLEWVQVPNPVLTSLGSGTPEEPGYVPPVYATQRCYLVKFVRAAMDDETAGLQQTDTDAEGKVATRSLLLRTKFGQWIMNNSVPFTINSADGRSWPSRRVGTNFWFVDSPDFGVWQ